MYDIEDFDTVFEHGGYSSGLVHDIQENQHALGGTTFFERLLNLLGITSLSSPSSPPNY
jgi:hypothetical protein